VPEEVIEIVEVIVGDREEASQWRAGTDVPRP
jgi:hypothetical protein